jgi:DNA-binding CsgD family transcriptional regulator
VTAIIFLPGAKRLAAGTKHMRRNRTRSVGRRSRIDFQLEPKERQALKLAEIREALVAAGYNTTAKQAAVLGIGRSTAWWLLNHNKRAGPSAKVIKRILLSPQMPKRVRRKVEQYVEEKVRGVYGHSEQRTRWFSEQFQRSPNS